jgi:hypothetical protein
MDEVALSTPAPLMRADMLCTQICAVSGFQQKRLQPSSRKTLVAKDGVDRGDYTLFFVGVARPQCSGRARSSE